MRGLLAIECLFHQIVAGNKSQTRRSGGLDEVNGREATKKKPAIVTNPDDWFLCKHTELKHTFIFEHKKNGAHLWCVPRYKIGEVLYLKEPIRQPAPGSQIWYKFNMVARERECYKWQNKLFMPASAARHFIKITGIRCERLHDITDEDCIAEGIEVFNGLLGYWQVYENKCDIQFTDNPKRSFWSLYKMANKITYNVPNLWVWVYTFEYLKNYEPCH